MNQVNLIGRLGKDPETRNFDNGKSVTTFSLATTEKYTTQSGEKKEVTQWHNCVSWGNAGLTIAKYVKKGHMFAVVGRLSYREWEKDGVKRLSTDIIVDNFTLLPNGERSGHSSQQNYQGPGSNDSRNSVNSQKAAPKENDPFAEVAGDDLPF